jgi:hypothetical protein
MTDWRAPRDKILAWQESLLSGLDIAGGSPICHRKEWMTGGPDLIEAQAAERAGSNDPREANC